MFISSVSFSQNLQRDWVVQGKGLNYANITGTCTSNTNHIYLTGFFLDSLKIKNQFLISRGSYDMYLAKFDTLGNLLWLNQFGGVDNDGSRAVITDNNGNVYVSGYYWKTAQFGDSIIPNNNKMNFFIAKYDADGNFLWVKTVESSSSISGYHLTCDLNNNIYSTGYMNGTITFGTNTFITSQEDIFLSKFSSNGDILWSKKRGGASGDYPVSIITDTDGFVYSTGTFIGEATFDSQILTSKGLNDVFVEKTDSLSNQIWIKHLGGKFDDSGCSISFDDSNNLYLSGTFQDTLFVDSEYIVSNGNRDMFLLKTNTNGNIYSINKYGSSGIEYGGRNIFVNSNKIYLLGSHTGSSVFGPDTLVSADYDPFLLRIDTNNSFYWSQNFIATGTTASSFNVIGKSIYMSGYFDGYSNCVDTLIKSSGNKDLFLMKISDNYQPIQFSKIISKNISCYNANDGEIKLEISGGTPPYTFTWSISSNIDSIVNLSAGWYYFTVTDSRNFSINDSIEITEPSLISTNISKTICQGETYIFGTQTLINSGNYSETFVASNLCDSIVNLNLTVNSVDVSVTQNNDILSAIEIGANYQWIDCNNNNEPLLGEEFQDFTVVLNGNYAVIVTKNTCVDTSACFSVISVGLNENNFNSYFSVYPNPSKDGFLNLEISENYNTNSILKVFDLTGKLILNKKLKSSKLLLDLTKYSRGIYSIEIKNKQETFKKRIVITK